MVTTLAEAVKPKYGDRRFYDFSGNDFGGGGKKKIWRFDGKCSSFSGSNVNGDSKLGGSFGA